MPSRRSVALLGSFVEDHEVNADQSDAAHALAALAGDVAALSLQASRFFPAGDRRVLDLLRPLKELNVLVDEAIGVKRTPLRARRVFELVAHVCGAAAVVTAECKLP